jgi:hypothetical protein
MLGVLGSDWLARRLRCQRRLIRRVPKTKWKDPWQNAHFAARKRSRRVPSFHDGHCAIYLNLNYSANHQIATGREETNVRLAREEANRVARMCVFLVSTRHGTSLFLQPLPPLLLPRYSREKQRLERRLLFLIAQVFYPMEHRASLQSHRSESTNMSSG